MWFVGLSFQVSPCHYWCIVICITPSFSLFIVALGQLAWSEDYIHSAGFDLILTNKFAGVNSYVNVKTCIMLQRTLVWILLSEWGGTWDRVRDVRHKLNLLAGSPVTVAYGFIGSGVRAKMELKSEMDRDSVSSAESLEWEWKTDLRYCDVLVDFQTGEIPSTGQIYIYTFVN